MPVRRRLLGIWRCAWFGLRPWWMYERVKHHRGGYLDHLRANARHAWRLASAREDDGDRQYEAVVNGAWDGLAELPADCVAS